MVKTYKEVLKQIETLKSEAEKMRQKEISDVVVRIQEAIAAYGLTKADLFGSGSARSGAKKFKTKAKLSTKPAYGDDQGNSWVGRGPRPRWLRDALAGGKALEDFKL